MLEALAGQGVPTTLIVATDQIHAIRAAELDALVDGFYVREAGGYDFAAWAHVASRLDLARMGSLWLVNDSVIGPVGTEAFSKLFRRIRASDADLIALQTALKYPIISKVIF